MRALSIEEEGRVDRERIVSADQKWDKVASMVKAQLVEVTSSQVKKPSKEPPCMSKSFMDLPADDGPAMEQRSSVNSMDWENSGVQSDIEADHLALSSSTAVLPALDAATLAEVLSSIATVVIGVIGTIQQLIRSQDYVQHLDQDSRWWVKERSLIDDEGDTLVPEGLWTSEYPRCAIDGTFVKVRCPQSEADSYFNRKCYASLVLQAVADSDGCSLDISCGMPGSVHDRRVLRRSQFLEKVETGAILREPVININNGYELRPYVLGDAGYTLHTWLMVPFFINQNSTPAQHMFTERQIRGRICVEQAFCILKARWRILQSGILSSISWAARIVHACCILHNLLVKSRIVVHDGLAVAENARPPARHLHGGSRMESARSRTEGALVRNQLAVYLMNSNE
ncbi:hypothetical protein R1sor_009056 [Riccia sorocarpa]|uniref:DDE Tnp4 domain-containing protein n=1 Tax=Riccia sorocarpa TaxID=122646 RepID=A0ABD3H7F7_9MARC